MKNQTYVENPLKPTIGFHSIHSTKIQRNIGNLVEIRPHRSFGAATCCVYIKLMAERKAGELLTDMPKAVNRHSSNSTLLSLEINSKQSQRWQQAAACPALFFYAVLSLFC